MSPFSAGSLVVVSAQSLCANGCDKLLRRCSAWGAEMQESGDVATYIDAGKIGVMVEVTCDSDSIDRLAQDIGIAMKTAFKECMGEDHCMRFPLAEEPSQRCMGTAKFPEVTRRRMRPAPVSAAQGT